MQWKNPRKPGQTLAIIAEIINSGDCRTVDVSRAMAKRNGYKEGEVAIRGYYGTYFSENPSNRKHSACVGTYWVRIGGFWRLTEAGQQLLPSNIEPSMPPAESLLGQLV